MNERDRVAILTWLGELSEAGVRASLTIAGERFGGFFAGVEEDDLVVMDVVARGRTQLPIHNQPELLVEFRDATRPGSWRFVAHCRQVEMIAPGRFLLSLGLPGEISSAEQRAGVRARVSSDMLQAAMWLERERRPAEVLEISANGAKLHIAPHYLRAGEAQPGTEFMIQFSGPVVKAVSRGQRESMAVVRRVIRDEPPWALGVELIRPSQALVIALVNYARQVSR